MLVNQYRGMTNVTDSNPIQNVARRLDKICIGRIGILEVGMILGLVALFFYLAR